MNRCDFKCVLKVVNVRDRRRSTGRLFHALGPATAKARSPMVERRVAGTCRTSAVDAERSRQRESTSDSGWMDSDRYCGAAPFRQRCTRMQSLYWMRSGTHSQCRLGGDDNWSYKHAKRHHQHTNTQLTGWVPFLSPNQQCQSEH